MLYEEKLKEKQKKKHVIGDQKKRNGSKIECQVHLSISYILNHTALNALHIYRILCIVFLSSFELDTQSEEKKQNEKEKIVALEWNGLGHHYNHKSFCR